MTACTLGSCESILEIDPISEITWQITEIGI